LTDHTDYPALYRESRERIAALVGTASDEQLGTTVPGCPAWSVADTVAHLSALAVDAIGGRLSGVPGDDETAAQVRERRGMSIGAVLAEWEGAAAAVEQALGARRMPLAIVHDVITHEADIRGALGSGRPPAAAWTASLDGLAHHLDRLGGHGTITVHAGEREFTAGSGDPVTTLDVDPYEFWRAALGRRSTAQMAGWNWSGDPAPYLKAIPVFGPTATDITEEG
jgi:uncharacterized protein (TIGR03083 family)